MEPYFRIGRPSGPTGENDELGVFRCWSRQSVCFFTTSGGAQENDKEESGSRVAIVGSSMISAKLDRADFMRASFDIFGGVRSDRVWGSLDTNLAKTWLAIDACPGITLRDPAPPRQSLVNFVGFEWYCTFQTFYRVKHGTALSICQLRRQLFSVPFRARLIAFALERIRWHKRTRI